MSASPAGFDPTRYRPHQLRVLALATVAFAASSPGQSFLISVFVDEFLAGTGISRTAFSALYAAGTIVSASAMLGLGRVVDRSGLRVAWVVVALVLAAACGLASVATGTVVAFLALALLRTSGQGSFPLVGTLLVARSFERRRGQAVAVANLGVTAASIALPPLVALLIVAVGWRHAYQVLGLAVLVVILPLGFAVRPGLPRDTPVGRTSAGDAGDHTGAGAGGTRFPSPVRRTRAGLPDLPSATAARLLLVLAAPPLIGTAITFHAVSILSERGIGFLAAGTAVGLLGVTAAGGVVLAGLVLDRVSTRTALLVLSSLELLSTLVLLVPAAPAAYAAFAVLGLAMGAVGVTNGTVWARTFGTAQLGRIQGTAQSATITSAAIAPLVPALSLSLSGSHTAGLVVLAVLAAAALAIALRAEPAR